AGPDARTVAALLSRVGPTSMRASCVRVRLAFLLLAALVATSARADVRVSIEAPRPGQKVENRVDQAPIRGTASADGKRAADFDVMIVLDVSGSTRSPSGVDVDGDGHVGVDPRREL